MAGVTAERVVQIERGIVSSMEREVQKLLRQQEQERELQEHRASMVQKYHSIEERRKKEHERIIAEHAVKAEKQKVRKERVLANIEEEKIIMAQAEEVKQKCVAEKHERVLVEREAELARHHAEEEKRQERCRVNKERVDLEKQQSKEYIWDNMTKHEDRYLQHVRAREDHVKDHAVRRQLEENLAVEKREEFKKQQEEIRHLTEEVIKKKYAKSDLVQQKKAADFQALKKMKEKFEVKKNNVRKLLEEMAKTGNVHKVAEELEKLKAHQHEMEIKAHQEWSEKKTSSSPIKGPSRSATSSGSLRSSLSDAKLSAVTSPVSPSTTGPLYQWSIQKDALSGSGGPSSAPRARARSLPPKSPPRSPTGNLPPRANSAVLDGSPAPGHHYARLMEVYKARKLAIKSEPA